MQDVSVIINKNMKYRIVFVQRQVNKNFQLVLSEMGPGQTSRAWYYHSPAVLYPVLDHYVLTGVRQIENLACLDSV